MSCGIWSRLTRDAPRHTSTYVSIRQHTSEYVSIRVHRSVYSCTSYWLTEIRVRKYCQISCFIGCLISCSSYKKTCESRYTGVWKVTRSAPPEHDGLTEVLILPHILPRKLFYYTFYYGNSQVLDPPERVGLREAL